MPFGRRGPAQLAGNFCLFKSEKHVCVYYARYSVVRQDANGKTELVGGACGAHLPWLIRQVWTEFKTAGIVQEIPGMWHKSKEL